MGTTREASKVTTVFETVSVCGARVPVPLVAKAPEAPPTAQSVVLNWPVILRVSSLCHAPASSMLPPVQLRKGGRQMEKTHNTEGLGSENISMFFSNSIANKKGFLPRPARFRAWTGGGGREAGSWQSDALQSHEHDIPTYAGISGTRATLIDDKGNLNQSNITLDVGRFYTYPTGPSGRIAAESRPVNISVPAILYLGLPA